MFPKMSTCGVFKQIQRESWDLAPSCQKLQGGRSMDTETHTGRRAGVILK